MLKPRSVAGRKNDMAVPATPTTLDVAHEPTRGRRARRSRSLIATAVAVLTLALSACTPEQWAMFDMINWSRGGAGRAPVNFDVDLWFKAQAWADKMAWDQRLSHSYLPDGLWGKPWRKLGENVGVGWSFASIHNAFMASTGHRNNILDPAFNHAAVGITPDIFGRYWVAQEFMQL